MSILPSALLHALKIIPPGRVKTCQGISHSQAECQTRAMETVRAGGFWEITAVDFPFFLPIPFRGADESLINQCKT